jgi:hypothetical protein
MAFPQNFGLFIHGFLWRVLFVEEVPRLDPDVDPNEPLRGLTDPASRTIYIDRALPGKLTRSTLLHELRHAFDPEEEDDLVYDFEEIVFTAFDRLNNPQAPAPGEDEIRSDDDARRWHETTGAR